MTEEPRSGESGPQPGNDRPRGRLHGVRLLDPGTVYAAPTAARLLGDYGAEVVKVEHPRGDPAHTHRHDKNGHGLWWKAMSRNKRTVTPKVGNQQGEDILRRLVEHADVLIENFRPRVMERWHLGPEGLLRVNPSLVVVLGELISPARRSPTPPLLMRPLRRIATLRR